VCIPGNLSSLGASLLLEWDKITAELNVTLEPEGRGELF
jgi:hypothetical protein